MNKYGSDKPDTRFALLINDITDIFKNTEFEIFKNILNDKGIINCLVLENGAIDVSAFIVHGILSHNAKFVSDVIKK